VTLHGGLKRGLLTDADRWRSSGCRCRQDRHDQAAGE
jgi:hypothetical protein